MRCRVPAPRCRAAPDGVVATDRVPRPAETDRQAGALDHSSRSRRTQFGRGAGIREEGLSDSSILEAARRGQSGTRRCRPVSVSQCQGTDGPLSGGQQSLTLELPGGRRTAPKRPGARLVKCDHRLRSFRKSALHSGCSSKSILNSDSIDVATH